MSLFVAKKKIVKAKGKTPTEFEQRVAQAIFDLETNSDLKSDLKDLHFINAREIKTQNGKRAILIVVPYTLLPQFKKIQLRLVRELEKNSEELTLLLLVKEEF